MLCFSLRLKTAASTSALLSAGIGKQAIIQGSGATTHNALHRSHDGDTAEVDLELCKNQLLEEKLKRQRLSRLYSEQTAKNEHLREELRTLGVIIDVP